MVPVYVFFIIVFLAAITLGVGLTFFIPWMLTRTLIKKEVPLKESFIEYYKDRFEVKVYDQDSQKAKELQKKKRHIKAIKSDKPKKKKKAKTSNKYEILDISCLTLSPTEENVPEPPKVRKEKVKQDKEKGSQEKEKVKHEKEKEKQENKRLLSPVAETVANVRNVEAKPHPLPKVEPEAIKMEIVNEEKKDIPVKPVVEERKAVPTKKEVKWEKSKPETVDISLPTPPDQLPPVEEAEMDSEVVPATTTVVDETAPTPKRRKSPTKKSKSPARKLDGPNLNQKSKIDTGRSRSPSKRPPPEKGTKINLNQKSRINTGLSKEPKKKKVNK